MIILANELYHNEPNNAFLMPFILQLFAAARVVLFLLGCRAAQTEGRQLFQRRGSRQPYLN